MKKIQPTIFFSHNFNQITKKNALNYCIEHKSQYLKNGNTLENFENILKDLDNYIITAEDLPNLGFSDQSFDIVHPLSNKSDVFNQEQLEKLAICLHMQWGKFSYSSENNYITSMVNPCLELEQLVELGYCSSHEWNRENNNGEKDTKAYFVTEKALPILKNLWGDFRCPWNKTTQL